MGKNTFLVRLVIVSLVIALGLPMGASAAVVEPVQPCASDYLNSYTAYVYPAGGGKIQVYFNVKGTNYWPYLGALRIHVFESTDQVNWTVKAIHTNDVTTSLMGQNVIYHSGHIDYQGSPGKYYKAYVGIWGGYATEGDSRYFYTSTKVAT